MITLKTGIIGSGKSLSAVAELAALVERWQTPRGEPDRRPVYVHGIRGLSLPHATLPVYPVGGSPGDAVESDDKGRPTGPIAIDWASVPEGSLVIIDECQDAFPPRPTSSKVPEHVAWCQRSRHHAVDIVLITQHPRLIDNTLRTFVGRHEHYRRVFGGARAVVYEWDGVSDSLKFKDATKRLWSYPRTAYRWYTSADEHTKQSFRLPAWLLVPVAAIALGVIALPQAYHTMTGAATGKGVSSAARPASAPTPAHVPIVPPEPHPGPAQGAPGVITTDLPARPQYAGCITMRQRCACIDPEGYTVDVAPALCRHAAREYGSVIPYPTQAPDQPPRVDPAASAPPA